MRILAIDYGDRHTGLATCDSFEIIASPYKVIHESDPARLIGVIKDEIAVTGAELVVVGNPVNNNGTEGKRSEVCKNFAEALRESLNGGGSNRSSDGTNGSSGDSALRVVMWDEFSSTVEANERLDGGLSRQKRDRRGKRVNIDAAAAAVILESYLNERRFNRDTRTR
ncbi:putative pre-16S rRNA nuclease [Clostridia bacterium]|nr:putative pre-16S rRNA nuclease [Clostridia bacterium]